MSDRWAVFMDGLIVTGVGMGLVFLTLILVALVIWALDRAFRVAAVEVAEETEPEVTPPTRTRVVQPAGPDMLNQVAAMAVSFTLKAGQQQPAVAAAVSGRTASAMSPLPWQALTEVDDEEITGEVITVATFAGSASWKARGRLDNIE